MLRHSAWAVGSVATEAAQQLPGLSELSQQEVFTIVNRHPVDNYLLLVT